MSTIVWSKWFWSDWLADHLLRRCSPAARGLWMDLMALSMQCEPLGYLADGDKAMSASEIARNCSMRKEQVVRLMAELERHGVCSRDERGRLYSRRIVREIGASLRNKSNGICGGNPQLSAENRKKPDNPQKPESKSQEPEASSSSAAASASPVAPLVRAAEAMNVSIDAFYRNQAWLVFGDTFETWVQDGCDAERDIWPVVAALTAKLGRVPSSPAYFAEAVRDARDRRLAGKTQQRRLGAPYLGSTALVAKPWVSPEEWADRLRVFQTAGLWAKRWGPKPGEAGCLAPVQKAENPTPAPQPASP
jgi:hypothetical protein